MRSNGTIEEWNDSRGFGFIRNSNERLFFHVSSLVSKEKRPMVGDRVTFDISIDSQQRKNARNVGIVGSSKRTHANTTSPISTRPSTGPSKQFHWWVVSLAMLVLGLSVVLGYIPQEMALLDMVLSLVLFILYGIDKKRAQRQQWRIPEQTLHLLALAGGWIGALIGQKTFRHKTQKGSFRVIYVITAVLNTLVHILIGLRKQ